MTRVILQVSFLIGFSLNCISQEQSVDVQFNINQTHFSNDENQFIKKKGAINYEGVLGYNKEVKFGYAHLGIGLTTLNYVDKYLPQDPSSPADPLFSEVKQKGHLYLIVPVGFS